ncbi:hypothetical protein M514_07487 [Trichuris suis]|uniref:Uncharacterized protein n=1 Tax=Trichuris suis TaxID=68888 RepID=A0A085NE50_9BILA|nr:hypothetical protein M513_07487 [Trichuris suis]KFD67746.1 hypothetical protein M514_07487 [Trichuris suis]
MENVLVVCGRLSLMVAAGRRGAILDELADNFALEVSIASTRLLDVCNNSLSFADGAFQKWYGKYPPMVLFHTDVDSDQSLGKRWLLALCIDCNFQFP